MIISAFLLQIAYMKPGKGMNDSANGMHDPSLKLDYEGQKQPGVVLDKPAYVGELSERNLHLPVSVFRR